MPALAPSASSPKGRGSPNRGKGTSVLPLIRKTATSAIKFANETLLQKLVPVLDNLDMALAATQTAEPETGQSLQTGINMICQQLKTALAEAGLEEVDAAGKPFDPNFHEAVSKLQSHEPLCLR